MGNRIHQIQTTFAVVVPIYKPHLSPHDLLSLESLFNVVNNASIYLICPNINFCNDLPSHYRSQYEIIELDPAYFESVQTYNKLLLSSSFYELFIKYTYILIFQTDAFIFRNDIEKYCSLNYDYIGAPWVNWYWSEFYASHISFPRRVLKRIGFNKFNLVGNGGFSLRKVSSAIFNCKFFKKKLEGFNYNEDYFFSFYINSYNPFYRVAPLDIALDFAFDENPQEAFSLNSNKLPMACHAWPKYYSFWEQYINIKQ
ncbi:MAG: hypothetical protein MH132_10640 [Hydrotalea sp.]|nr:hypothetical protein [Hydrotalea sp.]